MPEGTAVKCFVWCYIELWNTAGCTQQTGKICNWINNTMEQTAIGKCLGFPTSSLVSQATKVYLFIQVCVLTLHEALLHWTTVQAEQQAAHSRLNNKINCLATDKCNSTFKANLSRIKLVCMNAFLIFYNFKATVLFFKRALLFIN